MRTLKLQVQMTLDGCIAAPGGGLDMFTWEWDAALKQHVDALTARVDTILLGRKLAEGFIPYWAGVAADASNPEHSAGRMFADTPKVVFSRTLDAAPWPDTRVAHDLADEVARLKRQPGGDLIAYGGGRFAAALVAAGLIDEYHLFVNPVAVGDGMRIFGADATRRFQLVQATSFACGIVALAYRPVRGSEA